MLAAAVKTKKEKKSRAVANSVGQKKSNNDQGFKFVDNRPEAIAQRKLQSPANNFSASKVITRKRNKTNLQESINKLSGNRKVESLPRPNPEVMQRHLFLDVPAELHETKDFGNWYTMACEYKQQKALAELEQVKPSPEKALEAVEEEVQEDVPPAPVINPSDFISSIRALDTVDKISKLGGVKMQIHGIPDLSKEEVDDIKIDGIDLSQAAIEDDGSIVKGKNVAIDNAFVSAEHISGVIMKKYGLSWEEFYPLYCFTADSEGQWSKTGKGGLGSGPLLNTPGSVVTFDTSTSMTDWADFEDTEKKYISAEGSWNDIDKAPLDKLTTYIENSRKGTATEEQFREALDQVYEAVAPEYDAFRRYIASKKGITGETPNPWGL